MKIFSYLKWKMVLNYFILRLKALPHLFMYNKFYFTAVTGESGPPLLPAMSTTLNESKDIVFFDECFSDDSFDSSSSSNDKCIVVTPSSSKYHH